jgi:hypothetical protein
MIRTIKEKGIKGVGVICTYQDPISPVISPDNKIVRYEDLFEYDNIYVIDNVADEEEAGEMILNHLADRFPDLEFINRKLINLLLTKAFKGNPLFILDIVDNLVSSSSYLEIRGKELTLTQELREMDEFNDWTDFNIPIRIEKILGSIIDNLDVKEIILLKHASIIGNLFDISKLERINPFDNTTFDDLYAILQNLEVIFFLFR